MNYILFFLLSFCMASLLTPIMIKIASKFDIFDKPDNKLKNHKKPMPYLGGVAIYLSFIVPLVLWRFFISGQQITVKGIAGISIGASLIFFVGLIDDIKKLSIHTKFFVQIVSACILVLCNIKIEFIKPEIFGSIVTVLWVVGVTNSMNIIDIMDGLSSGVAFISAITFFLISLIGLKIFSPMISLCLAGSTLGFLIYNFNPAKIFMGDAGSLFLGFILSSLAITESYSGNNDLAVLSPILILIVPIFDTLFVMFVRAKKGLSMFYGSPDHFPIRLTKLGWSRKKVVLIIYIISTMFCILAVISMLASNLYSAIIYISTFVLIIFFARFLEKKGDRFIY